MTYLHKLKLGMTALFFGLTAAHYTMADIATQNNSSASNTFISPFGPYELNYIIPFNYTTPSTNYDDILPNTSNKKYEVKFQISSQTTLINHLFCKPLSLNAFYTQVSYWQFYAKSAYFRETNYNPGLFFHFDPRSGSLPFKLKTIDLGAMHQSNGRGSDYERSWNRIYLKFSFQINSNLSISARPWYRVHMLEAKDYNPDLTHYLGDGDVRLTYLHNDFMVSLMLRNILESGFARGAEELDMSFPLYHHFHMFLQGFTGYGQSLISYNHYTNSIGIGFSLFNNHTPGT